MPLAPTRTAGAGQILARADFRRLFGVRLSAQWADGTFQASLAGAVLFNPERVTDPAGIAAAFAVLLLPYSVVGPFAGVLLDRWSRQRVLLAANLLRCALVLVLAAVIASGYGGVGFYAAALVVISVNRFFLSALSAALPHVVDHPTLVTANALSTTAGTVATVLGGGMAVGFGALLGGDNAGYAGMAAVSVLGYAGSALLARGFPRAHLGPDPEERAARPSAAHVLRGLVAGARHIAVRRPALAALVAIGMHRLLFGLVSISTLLLYRNYFTDDGAFRAGLAGLTQVLVVAAVGSVLAALLTPVVVRRVGKAAWITAVLGAAAAAQVVFWAPYDLRWLVLGAGVIGFAGQALKICVDTIVQESIDDAYRGRVFSVYDTVFNVAYVAAAVLAAFAVPDSGRSYLIVGVIAAGYALTAAGYAAASRQTRRAAAAEHASEPDPSVP